MCIQVNVNLPRGGGTLIDVCDNMDQLKKFTVRDLKRKVSTHLATADDLRIIFKSQILDEESTLESLKIKHLSTIHTVLRLPGGIC